MRMLPLSLCLAVALTLPACKRAESSAPAGGFSVSTET